MKKFLAVSFFILASFVLLADGTKLDNKYVNADYDFVDDPARPTILQTIGKRGAEAFDAMTAPEKLAPYVASAKAADALLAEVKPNYGTDVDAACRISAISQYVMEGADAAWWQFWKTSRTSERRLWTEALLRAAAKAQDDYVICYYLDQLRWCGFADQVEGVKAIAEKSGSRHVMEVAEIVMRDL